MFFLNYGLLDYHFGGIGNGAEGVALETSAFVGAVTAKRDKGSGDVKGLRTSARIRDRLVRRPDATESHQAS